MATLSGPSSEASPRTSKVRRHLETLGPCLALSPALSPAPYPCLATQSLKKEVVSGVSRQPGPRGGPHPQATSLPGPPIVSFQGARARSQESEGPRARRVVRAMRTRERRCEPLRMEGTRRADERQWEQARAGGGKGQ